MRDLPFADFLSSLSLWELGLIATVLFYIVYHLFFKEVETRYNSKDEEAFRKALGTAMGGTPHPLPFNIRDEARTRFLQIPPHKGCPFHVLCTMGLGADEEELIGTSDTRYFADAEDGGYSFPGYRRIELLMYLPEEWAILQNKKHKTKEEEARYLLPLQQMNRLVYNKLKRKKNSYYCHGRTMHNGAPLREGSPYCAYLFSSPLIDDDSITYSLQVNGKEIHLLQVTPITQQEYDFLQNGERIERMVDFLPFERSKLEVFLKPRLHRM